MTDSSLYLESIYFLLFISMAVALAYYSPGFSNLYAIAGRTKMFRTLDPWALAGRTNCST